MENKFWSIPLISVYLYAVTILTQYGFNSYFNIPPNFIEASIQGNTVYFYQLFQLALAVIGLMKFWMWAVLAIGFLMIVLLHIFELRYEIFLYPILILVIGGVLFGSYNFGNFIAASTESFYVLSSDCPSAGRDGNYIIPIFYEGKAILVPIDGTTKKLQNGFIVKEMSELACKIELKEIGRITK